eukprot:151822_1
MSSENRISSINEILTNQYKVKDANLVKAIVALGEASAAISTILTNYVNHTYAGTQNKSGDDQLDLDIDCDKAVFQAVRDSKVYTIAASEETPVETVVGEGGDDLFSLGFDPLDGSSII